MLDTSYGFNNLLKEVSPSFYHNLGSQTLHRIRRSRPQEYQRLQINQWQDQEITRSIW